MRALSPLFSCNELTHSYSLIAPSLQAILGLAQEEACRMKQFKWI